MGVVTAPTRQRSAALRAPRTRTANAWRDAGVITAFLAPALLVYAIFVLYPIVQSVGYSLYQWSGIAPGFTFVGRMLRFVVVCSIRPAPRR